LIKVEERIPRYRAYCGIMSPSRRGIASAIVLVALCACAAAVNARSQDLRAIGRILHTEGEDNKRVALTGRVLGFATKYELLDAKSVSSNAKAYILFGWQEQEKAVKYAVLTSKSQSEALTAATGADIKGLHLGVDGTRTTAAKAEMPLAKASGAFHEHDGYLTIGAGTIKDANVSAWTNSLNVKTVADLWKMIEEGKTYLTVLTTKYPEGEVRGQIDWTYDDLETVEDFVDGKLREDSNAWRLTFLTPNEQTAPVTGAKTARGMAIYAWDGSKILYHVVSGGVKPSDALSQVNSYKGIMAVQLHVGAMRGAASTSAVKLTVPTDEAWKVVSGLKVYANGSIADADLKASNANGTAAAVTSAKALFEKIVAGETYTNIMTATNPKGEIRGQNDWNYKAVDVSKDEIPGESSNGGASATSFASALTPSFAVMVTFCFGLLLLA